jgi:hypothetical protein
MAKGKRAFDTVQTVIVRSNVHTGGLKPREEAEVENNEKTRELIALELWTLLRPVEQDVEVPAVESEGADPASDDVQGLPDRDPEDSH